MRWTVRVILCGAFLAAAARAAETGTLRVRVTDAETGAALPARLSLRAADGSYPGDRLAVFAKEWPGLEAHAVYTAGESSIELPAGEAAVTAARGPDYETDAARVMVESGKVVDVGLKLRRVVDLRKLGWVCGDAHVHMIHGEMQRQTSYADVALTCRAMGLDWTGVNQEYVGAGEGDLSTLKAACAKVSTDDFRLFVGGERPKSLLGHNALIGVDDPFVIPDDPPYHAAARAVHAAGGVLFPVHPVRYFPEAKYLGKWLDFPGNNLARELVFDALCGPSFDGLSVLSDDPANGAAHALWFNLLNRGLFVPAFADSDACFDRPVFSYKAPGFWRTYLQTGGKTDPAALDEAVRQGRTMATTGPVVLFDVGGAPSGSTLPPDGSTRRVRVEVFHPRHHWTLEPKGPDGAAGISKVELIRNGVVVKNWEPGAAHAVLTHDVAEKETAWYAVRAYGFDRKWQVALASPVYFRSEPAARKQAVFTSTVRGRVYDFRTGEERAGRVTVRRGREVLKEFDAAGQFRVKVPIDATVSVGADGVAPMTHDLLLGYGPVHRFLWNLRSADLADARTFEKLESLFGQVDLEFPLGHVLPGCYAAASGATLRDVKVLDGPAPRGEGPIEVAAVLLDASQAAPGDVITVAAIFRQAGAAAGDSVRLVAEGRAYDPRRPSGFGPLKVFGSVEENWPKARDIGAGYRMVKGTLKVPEWAVLGPAGAVEINVFSRGGGPRDGGHVGLRVPIGPTRRELMLCTAWPTMPLSWPDHNYGVGPLRVCGKNGREGQPTADYRTLHLSVRTDGGEVDLLPMRDGRGCPDADDAVYAGQFLDQVLNEASRLAAPDPVRPQPDVQWRDMPVIDATGAGD